MSINVDDLERCQENAELKANTPVKKIVQKGKSKLPPTVNDCVGGWDLSELEIIDDNNDNNGNNKKCYKDDEEKKNEF